MNLERTPVLFSSLRFFVFGIFLLSSTLSFTDASAGPLSCNKTGITARDIIEDRLAHARSTRDSLEKYVSTSSQINTRGFVNEILRSAQLPPRARVEWTLKTTLVEQMTARIEGRYLALTAQGNNPNGILRGVRSTTHDFDTMDQAMSMISAFRRVDTAILSTQNFTEQKVKPEMVALLIDSSDAQILVWSKAAARYQELCAVAGVR